MKKYAIIVAGGKGLRMGGNLPKQFVPLNDGKPLLMHTLERFYSCDPQINLIVVLPCNQVNLWNGLCQNHAFTIPHQIAFGGEERYFSVKNGLESVPCEEGVFVAVHDGVRPFVSHEVINNCFEEAIIHKAVVPVIEVMETIRYMKEEEESETVNRSRYRLVQTPQVFEASLLKKAYGQPYEESFTDDASLVEALGEKIHLVKGNRENIKVTTIFDLQIAKALL